MSSFRDKLNSKLNINTNNKPSSQKLTSFDETFLKINVVGGQTQLCPIKLNCQWAQPNIHNKQPELVCKWFNKTDSSMALIQGVTGSYYQPCFSDVGTIIHVQCMPQLQGVEYEGMPIIKEIGPVKIDPETQEQANELLAGKKATFAIKVRYVNQDPWNVEGLVRIQNNTIKIISKPQQGQKQLLSEQINENNIKVKCMRIKSKQLQISTVNEESKILIELTNNKIRDVLVLLVKLTFALSIDEQEPQAISQPILPLKEEKKEQFQQKSLEKIQLTNSSSLNEEQSNNSGLQEQNLSSISYSSSVQEQNSFQGQNSNSQQIKVIQFSDPKQKQNSAKGSADQKSLKSEQQLKVVTKKGTQINQIKSSEDLSNIGSPKVKIQKTEHSLNQVTPSVKTNALEVLQLNDLKKEMRVKQGQISQLKKTLSEKNDKIQQLHELMNRMKQREGSLSCNYFQLEDEVKKLKETMEKNSEEISYYRNENRILKIQCQNLSKKNKQLIEKVNQAQEKLAPFLNNSEQVQEKQTFQQLKQKYLMEKKLREQSVAKYQYMKDEVIRSEQKLAQLKEMLQAAEQQKKFYKKKYETASQQYSSGSLKLSQISIKSAKQVSEQRVQDKQSGLTNFKLVKYEQQILELKKQLKELVEMNNFLRQTSAITSKDKKSTSKTQLKLELLELKKIVNRLTEAITQKDLALDHMKSINKEINQKLIECQKKMIQQELKINSISQS